MGIHNLNKFLKKEAPNVYRKIDINIFKGTRIAIDCNLILYKYFSKAYATVIETEVKTADDVKNYHGNLDKGLECFFMRNEKENYKKVVGDVCNKVNYLISFFLKKSILPVFVLDGKCIHEKTEFARIRRTEAAAVIQGKMNECMEKVVLASGTEITQLPSSDVIIRIEEDEETEINIDAFKKKAQNCPPVNRLKGVNDFEIMKKYIKNILKIPFIVAPNESEKYCSFLTRKRFAAAVYTTDTDCFAFGATLIINEIDFAKNEFLVCQPTVFLEKMKMSHENFVDFCILLGCDFNSKVKGLGFTTIWNLLHKKNFLTKSNLIENVERYYKDKDFQDIRKDRCREIFLKFDECEEVFPKHMKKYSKKYKMKKDFMLGDFLMTKKRDFEWDVDNFSDVVLYGDKEEEN